MREFYSHALADDVIGYIFTDIARLDLEEHLPIIVDFWESLLFSTASYAKRGRNPLAVHKELHEKAELTAARFARWLEIFEATADGMFAGERTDFLKMRAVAIAAQMQRFLNRDGEPKARPLEIDPTDKHPPRDL